MRTPATKKPRGLEKSARLFRSINASTPTRRVKEALSACRAPSFYRLLFPVSRWAAVSLVSCLLIGFYFTRPTAIHANMKAFNVNRIGDFRFLPSSS
jgi:hypothetical protein